jgi:hypothetical protein
MGMKGYLKFHSSLTFAEVQAFIGHGYKLRWKA